jgi:hypothetical protein
MRKILLLGILLTCNSIFAQEFDVRNAKWGMSINEVMSSEYPLTPDDKDSGELEYKNVELSNGGKATILFTFKNRKLNEVKYIMYGYDASFSKGTCKNIVSLYDKIRYTSFVFDALMLKEYKCHMGWYLVNCSNTYPVGYDNCDLDKTTIDKIEKAAREVRCEQIGLSYENKRTRSTFYFNQYQNTYDESKKQLFPCNSSFYNTYYWLVFSPSFELKRQINKTDF